jgi:deoxycytidylate deaminase
VEIFATGAGHAEAKAIAKALELGLKPIEIAATTKICSTKCAPRIIQLGIKALTRLRD